MCCCVFARIDKRRGRETSLPLSVWRHLLLTFLFSDVRLSDGTERPILSWASVAGRRPSDLLLFVSIAPDWALGNSLVCPLPSPPVSPLVERSFEHPSFVGLFLCELVVVPWCRSVVCCSLVLVVVGSNLGSGICHQLVSIYTRYWLFSPLHSLYNRY